MRKSLKSLFYNKFLGRRYMMVLYTVLFIGLVSLSSVSFAQEFYTYNYLRNDDGLTSNSIRCFAQDMIGYMWIGGVSGLNRYDGYEVRNYYLDIRDDQTIPNNSVTGLYVDTKGILWVGTRDGICSYNAIDDNFKRYSVITNPKRKNAELLCHSIMEDLDGQVWVGMYDGEFYRLNNEQEFEYVDLGVETWQASDAAKFDELGNLWIGTRGVLGKYNPKTGKYKEYPFLERDVKNPSKIEDIEIVGDSVWIAALHIGPVLFDSRTETFQYLPFINDVFSHLNDVFIDHNGVIWFASGDGLFYLDKSDFELKKFRSKIDIEFGAKDLAFYCVFEDAQYNMWFGMTNLGVSIGINGKHFSHINRGVSEGESLQNSVILCLETGIDNELYIGSTSGIDVIDEFGNLVKHGISKDYNSKPDKYGDVWQIFRDKKNNIWTGTYKDGLGLYDPLSKSIEPMMKNFKLPNTVVGKDVRSISEGDKGGIWLAIHGSGISCYNPKTREFSNSSMSNSNLVNDWTEQVLEDSKGNLWVATGGGLSLRKAGEYTFTNYSKDLDSSNGLSANGIHMVFEDSDNNIWIGTEKGLNLYNDSPGNFKRVLREDGLCSDNIAAILEDEKGFLWISTKGGGLMKFDSKKWIKESVVSIECFDSRDGLQSNEFNNRAAVKDSKGVFYFGGVNGITKFLPERISKNLYAPLVLLSDLKILNQKPALIDDRFKNYSVSFSDTLELNYDENVFSLGFTAINYVQPEKNNYAYKLDGFDRDWYFVQNKREATYTNLPPGEYLFQVKATNNDGLWSDKTDSLKIIVNPPWWNTIQFKIFTFFLILGIMYTWYFVRTRRIRYQKMMLEEMVRSKTSELAAQNEEIRSMAQHVHEADESKFRFFMNISHELKTPLSLIISPVEHLITKYAKSEDLKFFELIHRNANRLLRLVNQLLDLRKLDVGIVDLNVSEGDIVKHVKEVFEIFSFTAQERDIETSIEVIGRREERSLFDVDILEKMIVNLLSNAFKFTPDHGLIKIEIDFSEQDHVLISVEDSGNGITKERLKRIFDRFYTSNDGRSGHGGTGIGLTLVKELASIHKGKIEVFTDEGKGTQFSLSIPIAAQYYSESEIDILSKMQSVKNYSQSMFSGKSAYKTDNHKDDKEFTVLVVEDDVDLRGYLSDVLSKYYTVKVATNGLEAYQIINDIKPDLVISDISMPEMDGMELCKKIKQDDEHSAIPIILLTAKLGDQKRVESYGVGANDYINKPFNLEVLVARIDNLIDLRQKTINSFLYSKEVMKRGSSIENVDIKFIEKAVRIVHENISDPSLGYREFCEQLNLGKTKLYERIGALTGESINIFIRNIRLERAVEMLNTGDMNISEISYQLGFNDPNYFSKCFRAKYGVSPKEFSVSGIQKK